MYVNYCTRNLTLCSVVEVYLFLIYIMVQVGPSPNICVVLIFYNRGAQISATKSPWRHNILRWRLIFWGSECGTCCKSKFRNLEFWGGCYVFERCVHPCGIYTGAHPCRQLCTWSSHYPAVTKHNISVAGSPRIKSRLCQNSMKPQLKVMCIIDLLAHARVRNAVLVGFKWNFSRNLALRLHSQSFWRVC